MARMRRGAGRGRKPTTLDPEDTENVKHRRFGVWDYYEQVHPELRHLPWSSKLEDLMEIRQSLPYVWRMLKDIGRIRSCWNLLFLYALVEFVLALLPAVALWFSGQLLQIVQTAVDTRTVDKELLLRISLGHIGCAIVGRLLGYAKHHLDYNLDARIYQHFSAQMFWARARLDVPTFEDPTIQRQLEQSTGNPAWSTLEVFSKLITTAIQIVSQLSVLAAVLRNQRDGVLLSILCFVASALDWIHMRQKFGGVRAWAATTKNHDYIRMQGWKQVVNDNQHRKEVVAGNLAEYATSEYRRVVERVGIDAGDFYEMQREYMKRSAFKLRSFFQDPLREMPQIFFALRAVQYPASIPVSLASLNLIQRTISTFTWTLYRFFEQTGSVTDMLAMLRKMYDIVKIDNRVADGKDPYPEDAQKVKSGIAVEFRNVSFKYPRAEEYALHDVSFKISQGQLCVIVGSNGSGKSTILKLIARLYDPTNGEILVDDKDIRSFKLADLRQTISVLFQDYTHFPLSIRENIGLGDPSNAQDEEHIKLAARLGGAEEFINRLPEKFDTYLDRPVQDYYSGNLEGSPTFFGRKVDYSAIRGVGGMSSTGSIELSGGQMQRLAVSRTFMRSVVSEESKVGILLFDEPSASLDPTAEHDLFVRLGELRGSKTMLFSSHRFGNLTKNADLILYMNDSVVIESGTHEELLKRGGDYARIWNLQAQAFI